MITTAVLYCNTLRWDDGEKELPQGFEALSKGAYMISYRLMQRESKS